MAAAVLVHFATCLAHGAAHDGAHVPLSAAATLFVFVVILGGPLVGLALSWRSRRLGSQVVAVAMAGALVFGLVNHFVLESPDHVGHVAAQWRTVFTATAVLLTITEALALFCAVRLVRHRQPTQAAVSAWR